MTTAICIILALACFVPSASGRTKTEPSAAAGIRIACVSVDMSGLPERGDLRASWLRGFQRPFRLDTLLVERSIGYHLRADVGSIRNQVRIAAKPCPQDAPD